MTSLIFIQNFGNYSFVCICWTNYCLRINCHSFESYWVVLPKYWKIMVSLPFVFCWRKHILSVIIQIFTKTHFSSNFWTAHPLNILTPHSLAFWEIYKYNDATWCIFLKSMKNCWYQQKNHNNICKQQTYNFPMRDYSSKSGEWFRS